VGVRGGRPYYPLPSKSNNDKKQHLQTSRPYNIAHRGSNGEIPEETAAAYLVPCFVFISHQDPSTIRFSISCAVIFYE
jgi:hypothetical protein